MQLWAEQRVDTATDSLKSFINTHMSNIDNIVELLLCLIRGHENRPPPSKQSQHADNMTRAVAMGAPYPSQQSSLSLATFALFKMAIVSGAKAGVPQAELEAQVAEIVRQLPSTMLYKALDAQYRAWSDSEREKQAVSADNVVKPENKQKIAEDKKVDAEVKPSPAVSSGEVSTAVDGTG